MHECRVHGSITGKDKAFYCSLIEDEYQINGFLLKDRVGGHNVGRLT